MRASTWGLVAVTAALGVAVVGAGSRPRATPGPVPSAAPKRAPTSTAAAANPVPAESAAKPTAEPEPRRAYTIAAIGDSLTDYRSHGGKYLRYVEERCPKSRIDNYGKGAEMVNQMRRRFARDVLGIPPVPGEQKPHYTHVIVFGGVNDLYSDLTAGRTPKKIARDLTTMYSMARQRGARVIAINVAPWGGFRKYYNERRGRATKKLNAWIAKQLEVGAIDHHVDAYSLLGCDPQPHRLCPDYRKPMRDGIHFGPPGHEALGKALYEAAFSRCL